MAAEERVVIGPGRAWVLAAPSAADAVRVWTKKRLPFATDQSPEQKALVALVAPHIRTLAIGEGGSLHARFVSADLGGRQPDAENITFYNWSAGDGLGSPFRTSADAVSFERSYEQPPPCVSAPEVEFPYFNEWTARRRGQGGESWVRGDQLATFAATCEVIVGEDAGREVWRALSEDRTRVAIAHDGIYDGLFGVDICVSLPHATRFVAAEALKGCLDGAIASFQRFGNPLNDLDRALLERHAASSRWRRPLAVAEFVTLVTGTPHTRLFDGAPFNRNGLDPCDDRCVCGSLRATRDSRLAVPEIAGCIYPVAPFEI